MLALVRRPSTGALVVGLVTLACLPLLPRLRVDNSLEVWIPHGGEEYLEYEAFRSEFGSEEYILVAYPLEIPLPDDLLERLVDLRFELEAVEGVRRVYDLSGIYSRFYALTGKESFEADLASPFFRDFLVSEDLDLAATWVLLDLDTAGGRDAVVSAVEAAIARADPGFETWLAGSPVLNVALDEASTAAARRFYPVVVLASAVILLLVFRRLAGVVIPIVSVGCGLVWTLALLVLLDRRLDMVTVALPPVVWVVGLATSIHLLARSQSRLRAGESARDAISATLVDLAWPCLMSAATTAVGFAALATSSMPPVREMGLFAAAGVLNCLAANFLLFPWLGRWWAAGAGRWSEHSRVSARLEALGRWVIRHRAAVLVAAAAVAAVALVGVGRLRANANMIEFFDDETEIARVYEDILPTLTGPYSMEVVLEAGPSWREPSTLRTIDRLAREIGAEAGVARVVSPLDFVKQAASHLGATTDEEAVAGSVAPWDLPGSAETLDEAWGLVDESLADEIAPLLGEGGALRLSVIARPMGSAAHRRLVERIETLLAEPAIAAMRPRLTGVVTLLVGLQDELIVSQARSFAVAFLVIVPLIALFFGSLSYALVSLPPNLLPILATLGFMGAAGVALNPATVMIAAVAFGIVVDDSIHFLSYYRARREAGLAAPEASLETLAAVGRPLWITSIVVAVGFSVLSFSSFVPLFDFGLLSAATLLAALAGNLILLPALLVGSRQLS
jgi:predicted RND superfamily exporter protein